MNSNERIENMEQRLNAELQPTVLTIEDESHLHAGHAGARSGKGHFKLTIKSEQFEGLRALQRHRLVYSALGEMMDTEIHALTIIII